MRIIQAGITGDRRKWWPLSSDLYAWGTKFIFPFHGEFLRFCFVAMTLKPRKGLLHIDLWQFAIYIELL
jgi:hypothetical protein